MKNREEGRLNKTMNKEKWQKLTESQKRIFLFRLIGGAAFLVVGLIFGIVFLAMNHWDFVKFITNPTVDLIMLVCFAFGIFCLSRLEVK